MDTVAADLAAWRAEKHITQEQASGKLGVSVRTYIRWEMGQSQPPKTIYEKMRTFMGREAAADPIAFAPKKMNHALKHNSNPVLDAPLAVDFRVTELANADHSPAGVNFYWRHVAEYWSSMTALLMVMYGPSGEAPNAAAWLAGRKRIEEIERSGYVHRIMARCADCPAWVTDWCNANPDPAVAPTTPPPPFNYEVKPWQSGEW